MHSVLYIIDLFSEAHQQVITCKQFNQTRFEFRSLIRFHGFEVTGESQTQSSSIINLIVVKVEVIIKKFKIIIIKIKCANNGIV